MAQINVSNLTFYYEGSFENIFDDVSFSIDTNWKLGFIGRNGKGKTTFLNLLMGKYEYQGAISTSTVFDYFPYRINDNIDNAPYKTQEFDKKKQVCNIYASNMISSWKPGCEEWRVICELGKLNEAADILYRPFDTLSPGERTKIMLAVLFSGDNDFLLIDEPTNHLDEGAREIVKSYLASKKGFILVSHDRDLLDACIDHVLVLNRKTIEVQSGNFTSWWDNKVKKDHFAVAENEKHKKEIRKLKQAAVQTSNWAAQNEKTKIGFDPIKEHDRSISARAYIGAKTKKMQNRVKQMEKRIDREIDEKEDLLVDIEQPVDLKLVPLTHHKKILVDLKDYGLRYKDADDLLFDNLTFSIRHGDRIALHGENGCGKSTLIKMLLEKAGYIMPENNKRNVDESINKQSGIEKDSLCESIIEKIDESGVCEIAPGLVISYVSQDTSRLKGSIADYCKEHELDMSLFCTILRQLDLDRANLSKNIEEYSEGQKKKVLIAASLLTPAHIYIWDEPLNYIDVFSRMQIEKLILEYSPTMLFVEHDVRFREKIATRTVKLSHCL